MKKQKAIKYLDLSLAEKQKQIEQLKGLTGMRPINSVLFSRGKKSNAFFTEDSKLYITPREQLLLRKGIKLNRREKQWDSANSRIVQNFVRTRPSQASVLLKMLQQRYQILNENFSDASENLLGQFSLIKLWNVSIVASILFGMIMMTFVYRYLGQGAAADQIKTVTANQPSQETQLEGKVLGADTSKDAEEFANQVKAIEKANSQQALEKEIRQMVKGYPIEEMVPYIAKQDRIVAAFMIAIAKKESGWGEHHPVLNGQDCYNYWGYRGQRVLMGTGGHTCFNSSQDAVQTVAKRVSALVEEYGKNTPAKMVDTWKCGTSCEGDPDAQKWISDVTMYFDMINSDKD